MPSISVRLDPHLYKQVKSHCEDTGQTRISLIAEAVRNLCVDVGIDRSKLYLYIEGEEAFPQEPPWQKWTSGLARYRTVRQKSKVLASQISDETHALIGLLTGYEECFGKNRRKVRRKVLEFGLRRYLEGKGIITSQIDTAAIEVYSKENFNFRQEHLLGLVHDDRKHFVALPDDLSFPATLRSRTVILIDSSVLWLCMGHDRRALRIFESCLKGKVRPVISTSNLTDVVLGGQGVILSSDSQKASELYEKNATGMLFSHVYSDLEKRFSALLQSGVAVVNVIDKDYSRAITIRKGTDAPWSRLLSLAAVSRDFDLSEIAVLRIARKDSGVKKEPFDYGYELVNLPPG